MTVTQLPFVLETQFKRFREEEKVTFKGIFGVSWQHKAFTRHCCLNTGRKISSAQRLPCAFHITVTPQLFRAKEKI